MLQSLPLTLTNLSAAYASGTTPAQVVEEVYRRIAEVGDPAIFIHLIDKEEVLAEALELGSHNSSLPLYGVPYVLKDNIDVAGIPTTAACPAYAYTPEQDAFVVTKLRAAGALVIGKTNLDQFATGLVGVRSPYGVPKNAIDPDIVPGGSSAGSAVAVGHGFVTFSLGTDTAGSGRVPAALNNIVGLKPSLGALSATGVVPACRSLDTISIFASTVSDARKVLEVSSAYDAADGYSRDFSNTKPTPLVSGMTIGVPSKKTIEFFGDAPQRASFEATLGTLKTLDLNVVELDFSPFYDVASMLYEGAWVAERYSVIEELLNASPEDIFPVTRQIISHAETMSSADVFRGFYRLKDLARIAETALEGVDALCVPTIPTFYTVDDLAADPVTPNSNFGTYTNFVNLLDMCGIAVPTAPRTDGRPGSVTFLAASGQDALCADLGELLESGQKAVSHEPKPVDEIEIVVCGAHMTGLPLNKELTSRGAHLVQATQTAPGYRFYALKGGPPYRPGLIKQSDGGKIAVEVWAMPSAEFGSFMEGIPSPLAIGSIELADGRLIKGFLVEPFGIAGAQDITSLGSWRTFLEHESIL